MKKEYLKPEVTLSMNGSLEGIYAGGSNCSGSFKKSYGGSGRKGSGGKSSGGKGSGNGHGPGPGKGPGH